MESFEEIPKTLPQELSQTQKLTTPHSTPDPANWNNDNEWVRKDLGKFQVPIPQEAHDEEGLGEAVPFTYTESKIVDTSFLFKPNDTGTSTMLKRQEEPLPMEPSLSQPFAHTPTHDVIQTPNDVAQSLASQLPGTLSLEELSDIKLQTREIIEKVVWKLVPELASQMIKEELDRLLAEK